MCPNPASSLLSSQKPERKLAKTSKLHLCLKKGKIYLVGLGVVLIGFLLVFFLETLWPQYFRAYPSSDLLTLVPQKPDFFISLTLKKNSRIRGLIDGGSKLQNFIGERVKQETQDLAAHFGLHGVEIWSEFQELAWARFGEDGMRKELLILKPKNLSKINLDLTRAGFLVDKPYLGAMIYQNKKGEQSYYYTLLDRYLIFTPEESFLKEIIDLQGSIGRCLKYDPDFRKVSSKLPRYSPLLIYYNEQSPVVRAERSTTGQSEPKAVTITSPKDNLLTLEAYYWGREGGETERDPSWLRFIPEETVGLIRGNGGSSSWENLPQDSFWSNILYILDFQMFEDKLARQYNLDWQANIRSLATRDFEIIATPWAQGLAQILIVPGDEQSEENLNQVVRALGIIATSNHKPQEKEVVLSDGSLVTEYVRDPSQDYILEKEIAGIPMNLINLSPSGEKFIYGRIGGKLVVSNSEKALEGIISSFRRSEGETEKIIPPEFSESREWFFFDLEKLATFGKVSSPLGFKKFQGVRKEDREGTLLQVWLTF